MALHHLGVICGHFITQRNTAVEVQGYTLRWITGCDDRRAAGQILSWEEASP